MQHRAHRILIQKFVPRSGLRQLQRNPDIGHHEPAGMFGARVQDVPQLGTRERDGEMRPDGASEHPSGTAVDAGRNSGGSVERALQVEAR